MNLPDRSVTVSIALLLVSSLLVACSGSPAATGSLPASDPPASDQPASAPTTSASPASAAPSEAPEASADAALLTACLTLGPQDCERARTFAASTLEAGDPEVRYVQVGPFSCATGDRCPLTLLARPEGDVVLEFPGGAGISVHLKVAADGSFEATRGEAMGVAVEPVSVAVEAGPIPFTLGHCGVFSGIDLDGSWWDPVGPVDMETGDAVNPTAGVLTFLDEDHATFVTPTGFDLQLVRREGPKFLPMCM